MQNWKVMLQDPRRRRQMTVIASGALALAGLGMGRMGLPLVWRAGFLTVATLIAGAEIGLRAVRSLHQRQVSIELLVTIAASGALFIGEFWEAAAVTFLFILGAYLEARTLSQTRQVIEGLINLAPTKAIVLRDGQQREVRPDEVQPGETVLVKPGAKIAIDGIVTHGRSAVDESAITGEPMPEAKAPGSGVFAGTVNGNGLIEVQATGVGRDTTLARIIRRVEEAQEEKAPTQRFVERFSRWYTPAIISLSAISYFFSRDAELALTLLVIGCPGALVISAPVSVVAGIGRAAKSGILIKGGEYLENAGRISAVALDKTGTLTLGKPVVTDLVALQPEPAIAGGAGTTGPAAMDLGIPDGLRWTGAQARVLRTAAAAEIGSEHPLASAILAAAGRIDDGPHLTSFESVTGRGVRAVLDGEIIHVGNEEFMRQEDLLRPAATEEAFSRIQSEGKTAVFVAENGVVIGVIGIADPIRRTARSAIRNLRDIGVQRIAMLTGDDEMTARRLAKEAGVPEMHAELLPEDKLAFVRKLRQEGHTVAMVGDGINDSPALAAADLGIAMGAAGTDLAIETADIALMQDDLMRLPHAIRLSKATLANIRQNLGIALTTVAGLLLGVFLGKVHMAGGMLVHEASVLIVILNAMRLLRKREPEPDVDNFVALAPVM